MEILGEPDDMEADGKRCMGAMAIVTYMPQSTQNLLKLPPKGGGILPLPIGDNKHVDVAMVWAPRLFASNFGVSARIVESSDDSAVSLWKWVLYGSPGICEWYTLGRSRELIVFWGTTSARGGRLA